MPTHRSALLVASMLVLAPLAACSSTRPSVGPLYRADLVDYRQLERTRHVSLYDALRGAHPEYFKARGRLSVSNMPETALLVYANGMLMGETDVLSWIPVSQVRSVRRLGVTETIHNYGRTTTAGSFEIEFRQP